MKKQIKTKQVSCLMTIIFSVLILATISSCTKEATADMGLTATKEKSTIIYTDVNPDSEIIANDTFNLDLNHDGIYDFILATTYHKKKCLGNPRTCGTADEYIISVTPVSGSNNGIIYKIADYLARPLDSLAVIDSSGQWSYITIRPLILSSHNNCRCGGFTNEGLWGNVTKYLGLKVIKGPKVYYGWVRLNVNISPAKLIVKDYAYNGSPNRPILAGQRY